MDTTRLSDAQLFELSSNTGLDPVIREAAEAEMAQRGLGEEELGRLRYRKLSRETEAVSKNKRLWFAISFGLAAVLFLWFLLRR